MQSVLLLVKEVSAMNIIYSPSRNSLSTARISSLLFVSCVGPRVHEWKPAKYVSSWLAKGRRQKGLWVWHQKGTAVFDVMQ